MEPVNRFILRNDAIRRRACATIHAATPDSVVTVSPPNRSTQQNALFWALLGDLSAAKPRGIVATPDEWKALVMHAAGHEVQFQTGLDGRPFPVGFRSSQLSVKQMSDLIDWCRAFAAENGVALKQYGDMK